MQSKAESAFEVFVNKTLGFLISWGITILVLPLYGFDVDAKESASITIVYTAISMVRSYIVRRCFNRRISG